MCRFRPLAREENLRLPCYPRTTNAFVSSCCFYPFLDRRIGYSWQAGTCGPREEATHQKSHPHHHRRPKIQYFTAGGFVLVGVVSTTVDDVLLMTKSVMVELLPPLVAWLDIDPRFNCLLCFLPEYPGGCSARRNQRMSFRFHDLLSCWHRHQKILSSSFPFFVRIWEYCFSYKCSKTMKLSGAAVFLAIAGCHAYLPPRVHRAGSSLNARALRSTTTSNDAAFSAFADSLEEEPKTTSKTSVKEKSWQSKLEDLLDPKTNLAERQVLLSELLNSNEEIRDSVMDAMANRKVCMMENLLDAFRHVFWCADSLSSFACRSIPF